LDIELPWSSFHAPLELRQKAYEMLGKPEVCGEPDFECTGCISSKDCEILNVKPSETTSSQRPTCKCLTNKYELLKQKQPCVHGCIYCYWQNK